MCITLLKNLIKKLQTNKPKNTQTITSEQLYNLIKKLYPKCNIKIFDNKYKTTTFSEYLRFIFSDDTNINKYTSEYMDCDDYAIALYGSFSKYKGWSSLAFGIVCASTKNNAHAFNIFIDNKHEIYFCEPQNDKIWLAKNDKKYNPYFIMI